MRWNRPRSIIAIAAAAAMALTACSAGSSTVPETSAQVPATTTGTTDTTGTPAETASPTTSASGSVAPATSPAVTPPSDAALSIGFVLEPASLDFTQTDGAAIPQLLLDNVYQTLVKQDQTGKIVPSLAKSWTVSGDNKTYTFQLQPKVTFSDGAAFTADDAVFSIDRVKTDWKPAVKAAMDVVDSATSTSPTELTVTLKRPSNSWLFKMTTRVGAMFSKTGVADLANKPIGTGPYVFTKWNRGDSIVLTRNDSYWGTPAPLETVTFKYFKDPTAMNNALLTGGIQVISTVQTPDALAQFDKSKYQIIDGTTNGKVMMTLNNAKPPLNDIRVRQAINYALDKKAILEGAWAGYGTIIGSHEVPTDPWYVDLADKYPHDVAKAKALLAEAGQTNLKLSLVLPPVPYAAAAAPIIVSQLAAAGITVTTSNVTFPVWLDQVFGKFDYQMTIINHVEARDVTTVFSGKPDYYTQYTNPKVAQLEADGDAGTPEQMITDFKQVVTILADDAAAAWLWAFPNLMVADKNVQGLPVNAIGESFDVATLSVG